MFDSARWKLQETINEEVDEKLIDADMRINSLDKELDKLTTVFEVFSKTIAEDFVKSLKLAEQRHASDISDLESRLLETIKDAKAKMADEIATDAEIEKNSKPYVEVISIIPKDGGGNAVDMKWNTKFIDELKKVGYVGESENEIIQQYLKNLFHDVAGDMLTRGKSYD